MTCNQCQNQTKHRQARTVEGFTGCAKAPVWEHFSPVIERKCVNFVAGLIRGEVV